MIGTVLRLTRAASGRAAASSTATSSTATSSRRCPPAMRPAGAGADAWPDARSCTRAPLRRGHSRTVARVGSHLRRRRSDCRDGGWNVRVPQARAASRPVLRRSRAGTAPSPGDRAPEPEPPRVRARRLHGRRGGAPAGAARPRGCRSPRRAAPNRRPRSRRPVRVMRAVAAAGTVAAAGWVCTGVGGAGVAAGAAAAAAGAATAGAEGATATGGAAGAGGADCVGATRGGRKESGSR